MDLFILCMFFIVTGLIPLMIVNHYMIKKAKKVNKRLRLIERK
jgi:hypothetical protein